MPTLNAPDRHSLTRRLVRLMRRRTVLAVERYPMVGLFGITATFIALEPWLGASLSNGLLVLAGVLGIYWIASVGVFKRPVAAIWKIATLISIIAAVLVFYQHGTRQRTEQNKALIKAKWESTKSDDEGISWEPIALRGTIEQSVSLRPSLTPKASLPSSHADSDPLETDESVTWMSTSVVRVEEIRERQSWEKVSFLAPFSVMGRSKLLPGDRVEIYGRWKLPGVATNPGQRDPTDFFTSNGYDFQLRVESAEQLNSGNRLRRFDSIVGLARYATWPYHRWKRTCRWNV